MAVPALLHAGVHAWFIPHPVESHHTFGTGFILIGALMLAEGLAGSVWYRSRLRRLLLPGTLIMLGWGMMAVTFIEPQARLVHFSMGLPLTIGGWVEAQHRYGVISRRYADAFIVPALLLAAFDTAFFHIDGPILGATAVTHGGLAIMAVVVASMRLYQSRQPTSLARSTALAASVAMIGVVLYLDGFSL
jgi:hypothetical protein